MKQFIAKSIFFRLAIALILGIIVYVYLSINYTLFFISFYLAVLSTIVSFILSTRQQDSRKYEIFSAIFGLSVMYSIFCIGYLSAYNFNKKIEELPQNKGKTIFKIELTDYPTEKDNSISISAKLLNCYQLNTPQEAKGKIIIYLEKDSNALKLKSGDILLINSILSRPKNKNNPHEFDYGKYLSQKGISGVGYTSSTEWQKIGEDTSFSLIRTSQHIRQKLLNKYQEMNIYGDEYAIISALTLGYKDILTEDIKESFASAGVVHILAVSGFHVGIIYLVLSILLYFMSSKNAKIFKYIVIILLIWVYAFITGLSASVCRASLMFSLIAIGKIYNRDSYIYNTIFLSAFILLLINPMWIFNLGFQLSYMALISIIYFQPKIVSLINIKNKLLKYLWELTSLSIAAQIGTAPLCFYYFNFFPNYFIFANFIAVPFASIIIYLDIFLFIVLKIPYINIAATFLLVEATKILYISLSFISDLPYSTTLISINLWQVLALYISVIMLGFMFYKIKFRYLFMGLISLIVFFTIKSYNNIKLSQTEEMVIFNDNKNLTINLLNTSHNIVFSTDTNNIKYLTEKYWIHKKAPKADYNSIDDNIKPLSFNFNGENFIILNNNLYYKYIAPERLKCDNLILTNKLYPSDKLFKYYFNPEKIIIASNVSYYNKMKFIELADKYNIDYYSMAESGAMRITVYNDISEVFDFNQFISSLFK